MMAHTLGYADSGDPVYFDCEALFEKRLTGIGRFSARLIEALARVRPVRLFCRNFQQDIPIGPSDVLAADDDVASWSRWLVKRPREAHDRRLAERSLAIFPSLRPAGRYFRREISVMHDFAALLLPSSASPKICLHYSRFFGDSCAQSDKVIAISESTRQDARWLCISPPEDVVVGRPGPSMCVRHHAYAGPVRPREKVVLVVSTLEPRKNGPFLLDWFRRTQVLAPDMQIWWVGPKGWWTSRQYLKELSQQARQNSTRKVKLLGLIPDRQLCALYQQAAFTIYPSLYEGFGFPVIDSLLHGTPVLCSFNSSLKEFRTAGVFYFDPGDAESLDAACRDLLASPPLAIDRAWLQTRFSWDGLTRKILELAA